MAGSDGAAAAVGSRRGDTLGGRALGRRDRGKQLLAVFFLLLAALLLFFGSSSSSPPSTPPSLVVVFSEAVISFCHAAFFFYFSGILFYSKQPSYTDQTDDVTLSGRFPRHQTPLMAAVGLVAVAPPGSLIRDSLMGDRESVSN